MAKTKIAVLGCGFISEIHISAYHRFVPDAEVVAVYSHHLDKAQAFAARMGVSPASVRVTAARTRFGSCSAKNGLCFSLYLMQYPPEAVDYVVVHELSHILHKNHGPAFWACVAAVLPDYAARRALLLR